MNTRKSRIAIVPLLVALLVVMSGMQVNSGTQAAFTDTANASNTIVFATGTVDLQVKGGAVATDCSAAAGYGDSIATALFDPGTSTRIPGDRVTRAVCVKNNGNLDGWVDLTVSTGGGADLPAKLWAYVYQVANPATDSCASGYAADGSLTTPGAGTVKLTDQNLSANRTYTSAGGNNISVTAGSTAKLCLAVVLPDASSGPKDLGTTINFSDANTIQNESVNISVVLTLKNNSSGSAL